MSKFGPNGGQVEHFIEAALMLPFDSVAPIAAEAHTPHVRAARDKIHHVPRSAARYSAIDRLARNLIYDLRQKYPKPTSTAERGLMLDFTSLLGIAIFAFEARPKLDDETVGLVVDPFAKRLGFEWRSWGVGAGTEEVEKHG